MKDSLATGYSTLVRIKFRNIPLERYASLGIPLNVTDSLNTLVDTCLRRPSMMGIRPKWKDICCIRTSHNLILEKNLASLHLEMLINGHIVRCGYVHFK